MAAIDDTLNIAAMYVRMLWRFRWVALLTAFTVSAVLWAYILLLPNQFEVKTKIYLDTDSVLRPLLKGLAVDTTNQYRTIELIGKTLLVRPNLEAVARKADMDLQAKTPLAFDQIVEGLGKRIEIVSTRRSNVFDISYQDTEPKRAYRVVEALLNIVVEQSLGDSRKDTSATRQFIEEQVKTYEAKLVAAEARLKEFKRRNVGMMPTDGTNYYARLEQMSIQVSEVNLALREAQQRVDAISAQLKGVPAYFKQGQAQAGSGASTAPSTATRARIASLEQNLDQLLLQYTDRHPDVSATQSSLAELRKTLEEQEQAEAQEAASAANADGAVEGIPNPLYIDLKIALGEAQSEVAALQARVAEFERRSQELKKLADTVPKVEAELTRLNRDYSVDRENYEALVQRRESLNIADEASQSTDDVRFNVIEPPREPLVPVKPDRIKLSAGALLVGLGSGVGLAFLLGTLRPTFYSRRDFAAITTAPVLGVISRVWTRRERLKRKAAVVTYAVGVVTLILTFGGVMAAHTVYAEKLQSLELDKRFDKLVARIL